MAELLKAMLLDIPEVLETARLVLRGSRAGQGAALNANDGALADSCMDARTF